MDDRERRLREKCYGRDELQKTLQAKYDAAAAGTPQLTILLGATGMGKTRLAQELYRWLTIHRDPSDKFPQGYWPDSFTAEAEADEVNPKFDERQRGA